MSKRKAESDAARASALATELHTLSSKLKRRLRELASAGDLTPSQTSVLMHLNQNGSMTVTTLARMEGVRSQSMGATIAVLETAGLVKGSPDPADGRQTILSLTAACRELIRSGRAARHDWLFHAIQTKLTPQEQEQLAASMSLLNRIVDT
ncbi:MarR family winged helix-turn-helix transcriptional regulator [Bradyrhizobium canariense]|uniref:DNA-binding transcriptional regulator, MarR family n=1 Tax=Bradyrhizobium canariense TaxID=255045 RepID=A0A1H1WGI1_9BRAD|nr:MarR family transcriptional regulator [Bradyrhizobium canariense]SDS95731.1 DNA-binding transcriptional regulator, MarR family [Bradyrhizobium canariense]